MILKTRDYSSQEDYRTYDTARLRKEYLVEKVFATDDIALTYSYIDRIIFGGTIPVTKAVILQSAPELRSDHFLDRREMGVINIGQKGTITVDGKAFVMNVWDAIYIPRGTKEVVFESSDPNHPAKFYMASAPAHREYPLCHIPLVKADHRRCGSPKTANERTINRFLIPQNCSTCQLSMGLTHLEEGSVWNTMPCHTHERRMEVYFYFDIDSDQAVIHLMGPKEETRHLLVHNEQAVISPSWSIHSGCGTKNYTFIWAMVGENQDFDDMDNIAIADLK
jgi:4-deoxy-L-threo-5-hexosulose-uronate ketol-isomerase